MNRTGWVVIALLIFLAGCVPSKTIEDMGIINVRGVDMLEDDAIKTTIAAFKFRTKENEVTQIVTGKAHTLKRARQAANEKISIELTPGSIQLELYSEEAAKHGLMHYIMALERDAQVSDTMYLTIGDSTAEEIIVAAQKNSDIDVRQYFNSLVTQNAKNNAIPDPTLIDFVNEYYKIGRDPYLPVLSVKDKRPVLSSVALFQDDYFVGKIPVDKAYLITMFHKTIHKLDIQVPIPLKAFKNDLKSGTDQHPDKKYAYASLHIQKGKAKTKLTDKQNMTFQTDVKLDLDLLEVSEQISMKDPKVMKKFEKVVEKQVKDQYERLLAYTQQVGADPFGYGVVYRINHRGNKPGSAKLHDIYPNINVHFNVKARIKHHGMLP
ncbi:Ger(x)C family spore germination protein [Lentibacillus sp. N15]|uniref:Ger(x)C family spore germination protein n=1 Tax=Lentibacillus songyuanensis TaxID=3136161 RepID=UPI0031BA0104